MRTIHKNTEPRSLTRHKLTEHADFDNYLNKNDLRDALVTEQRGLCCYCMSQIKPDNASMKIEHWKCQTKYRSEQLNYRNILGACCGGEGLPDHLQYCDTKKGDGKLKWNPADLSHHIETRLFYDTEGMIRSDEPDFDSQLNNVLNLNLSVFTNIRKGILSSICYAWKIEKDKLHNRVPREWYIRQINRILERDDSLEPFCQVKIWWLSKKLERATR